MIARPYSPLDWDVIAPWFEARPGWVAKDLALLLPPNAWVVEDGGVPIAACWLYLTDANVALLEWSVTRPGTGLKGLRALELAVKEAKKFAAIAEVLCIFQFMPNERLVNYYERRCGFKATERCTLMVASPEGD